MSSGTVTSRRRAAQREGFEYADDDFGVVSTSQFERFEESIDDLKYSILFGPRESTGLGDGEYSMGADQIFVLGDNRDNSMDSRVWGPIPVSSIVARPRFIWWSSDARGIQWSRIGMSF